MATITPIRAPVWPPKPDLSNEVEWGPLPTRDEYTQAYRCWQCPNDAMRVSEPANPPQSEAEGADIVRLKERKTMEILAYNVYKSLEPALLEPHTEPIDIQKPHGADGWRFPSINNEIPGNNNDLNKTELEGHNILQDKKYWTIPRIQAYLESQGHGALIPKKPYHTAQQRREILQEYVNSGPSAKINTPGLYPRSNLGSWGLPRENQFIIPPSHDETRLYNAFELYTWAIHLSPYNPTYWLSRAHLFYQLCHFDLALGDAYRAWYLIEMLVNATERNKQPGLYPRIWDAIARHIEYGGEVYRDAGQKMRKENGINYFVPHVRRTIHHIISLSLFALRAWEEFEEMDKHLPARLLQVDEYKAVFERRRDHWQRYVAHAKDERENKEGSYEELWKHEERMGTIHPRPYPQAGPAIDRTDEGFLRRLNEMLFDENESPLIIDEGQGGGLRVIAKEPIAEDQIIFVEEPSARSHLRRYVEADNFPSTCENCKFPLAAEDWQDPVGFWKEQLNEDGRRTHKDLCACVVANMPLFFCSRPSGNNGAHEPTSSSTRLGKRTAGQMAGASTGRISKAAKGNAGQRRGTATSGSNSARVADDGNPDIPRSTCLQKARQKYHRHVCGKNWRWLHIAMGRIPQAADHTEAVNHERHGTFLSLLLREVFDMTLMKRDASPGKHRLAHEINPMIPLQSESSEFPFPFGWSANIVVPFGILQELGVNIFKDLEFDTWVIQTVLRKLLINKVPWDEQRRGTDDPVNHPTTTYRKRAAQSSEEEASGQQTTEGANLENLYIHTGFSMFNHGCSDHANAYWFWDDQPLPENSVRDRRVRNRIVVKSRVAIDEGSEVRLNYYPEDRDRMSDGELVNKQRRILGRTCDCPECDKRMRGHESEEGDEES